MISARLIAAGRSPATPVVLVENASQAGERRALATLATLPEVAAAFDGPAILIIGEVAALAEVLPRETWEADREAVVGAVQGLRFVAGAEIVMHHQGRDRAAPSVTVRVRAAPPPPLRRGGEA
jgi:hypothetical protein